MATYSNFATSAVAGGAGGAGTPLNAGDTSGSITASTGSLFPSAGPFMLLFGTISGAHELARCTAISGDNLTTLVRGQEGTTAQTWAAGTPVQQVVTAGNLAALSTYNVKDYGAKGDGSTDDIAAINAAITAASAAAPAAVFFPPNSAYAISTPIIVDHDNIALFGLPGELDSTKIVVKSGSDPSYAVIFGNTKSLLYCACENLTLVADNYNTAHTGGGLHFCVSNGVIKQVRAYGFGGKGVYVNSFNTSNIYQVLIDDLVLIQNGINASTPADGLHIGQYCSDAEIFRAIVYGGSQRGTPAGRHGIYNQGGDARFIQCHTYFNLQDGFHCDDAAFQPIQVTCLGCVFETNANYNAYFFDVAHVTIESCAFYDSTGIAHPVRDLYLENCTGVKISACDLFSVSTNQNLGIFGSGSDYTIVGNDFKTTSAAVACAQINGPTRGVFAHNNVVTGGSGANPVQMVSTDWTVNGNTFSGAGIAESGAADRNVFTGNILRNSAALVLIGAGSRASDNQGYNPVGQVTAPAFPATTVAATNGKGVDVTAYIANGTSAITVVQVAGQAGSYVTTGYQIAANGWGLVRIPAGGGVKFTYGGGTPTWTWMGD